MFNVGDDDADDGLDMKCRSAYFRLGHMLEQKVRCRCVLALTATATKATEADVTKVLKIDPQNVVRDSTVRDNLRLSATHFNGGMLVLLYCWLCCLQCDSVRLLDASCPASCVLLTFDTAGESRQDVTAEAGILC